MPTSYLYTALDWMNYLHRPPPASWVVRAAATFRILALLLILPCVFLTALVSPRPPRARPAECPPRAQDVASYLIVRTLGADSAHRPEPAAKRAAPEPARETCFATPSAATFALAGEDIFSPPASRAASPPPETRMRKRGAPEAEL